MARIKIEIDTESSNPISIQSRATSLPQGIGIVSSIGYDAKMTTAFNAGLGSLNPTQRVLDKLKFKNATNTSGNTATQRRYNHWVDCYLWRQFHLECSKAVRN
jgi:hypothetical protein